jgi:hypothetical protein
VRGRRRHHRRPSAYLRLRGFFHELFEEPGTEEEVMKSIVMFASAGGGAFADIAGEGREVVK